MLLPGGGLTRHLQITSSMHIQLSHRGQQASSEANWSGSTLFEKAGHIRVQQDKA